MNRYPNYDQVRSMQPANVKQVAHELIDQLPENSTWDDVLYEFVMRKEIELGLADSDAGRTTPVDEVMKEFGFNE